MFTFIYRWVLSKAKKDDMDSEIAIYDGRWEIEELKENQVPGDRGLVLKSKAKHHAIAAVLEKPFIFADKPLIVQKTFMIKHPIPSCLDQINVERIINFI